MRRRMLLSAVVGAGMYLATPFALKRAFAPPRREIPHTPRDLGLPEEEVWIDGANGTRLHAWWVPVEHRAPAVIVLHGWGGNASLMLPVGPHIHRAGFHALFLDARNHGLSEHDDFSSMPRFAEDLEAAFRWLEGRDDVADIGIVGHSVGAGAAILATSRGLPAKAVVSVSAFAHPGELMRAQGPLARLPRPIRWWVLHHLERMIGFRFDEIAPRNRIGDVTAPLLLVHGDADPVVPVSDAYELADRMRERRLIVVPGGGHSDLEPFQPYLPRVLEFLSEHLEARV